MSDLAAAVERTSVTLYQKSVKDVEKCLLHICAPFVVFLYFLCLFNSTVVFSYLLCLPYNYAISKLCQMFYEQKIKQKKCIFANNNISGEYQ